MAEIDVGDAVPLFVNFTNKAGAPTDPTTVVLTITNPAGVTTTPATTHPSTGHYEYDLLVTAAGTWDWEWTATGAVAAVERGSFTVRPRNTVDVTPGGAEANSYLTVDEADAMAALTGMGPADQAWLDAPSSTKEKALIRATSEIDAYLKVAGSRYSIEQSLLFPRTLDVISNVPYILADVQRATYAQAAHLVRNAEVLDNADSRRARGLISFSDDDGSGSVVSTRPEFGQLSSRALQYLRAIRGLGRATLRSVRIVPSHPYAVTRYRDPYQP
jgi:hypothetical protein